MRRKENVRGGGQNVLEGYLRGSKVNELEGHYPANNWTFSERCKNVPITLFGCSVKMFKKRAFVESFRR